MHLHGTLKIEHQNQYPKLVKNKEHFIHYHAAKTITTQIFDETKLLFKKWHISVSPINSVVKKLFAQKAYISTIKTKQS